MNLQYFLLLSLSGADVMSTFVGSLSSASYVTCYVMVFPLFHLLPKYFLILDTQPCVFRWWYSPQWLEPAHFHRLVCKHVHLLNNSREMIIFLGRVLIDEVKGPQIPFVYLETMLKIACSQTLYFLFKVCRAWVIKYKPQGIF